MTDRIAFLGGLLLLVLALAGCQCAKDEAARQEQKLAFATFNHQQVIMFDAMMDDLEAKMISAGAYDPAKPYEPKNIYPEGRNGLGPVAE